ncbi:hypothetical protein [Paraburkholderia sp. RL17-337-BIB-A]|uniref:hypothetical protein n=1 Tax=Paraburkholderia sp. RL17-337-BIB-A TaxID=3031636 RepID=UPI0038BB6747
MQNVSDLGDAPIIVWLTLVSLTPAGIVEVETAICTSKGVSVIEVRCPGDRSQRIRLSAPSARAVSRLAYRLASIEGVDEVRVERCFGGAP